MYGGNSAQHLAREKEVATDGSGGPEWAVKDLRRVGTGAAVVTMDKDNKKVIEASFLLTSPPGKQTVPRAETWAWVAVAKLLDQGAQVKWWCDASYTVTRGSGSASHGRAT